MKGESLTQLDDDCCELSQQEKTNKLAHTINSQKIIPGKMYCVKPIDSKEQKCIPLLQAEIISHASLRRVSKKVVLRRLKQAYYYFQSGPRNKFNVTCGQLAGSIRIWPFLGHKK